MERRLQNRPIQISKTTEVKRSKIKLCQRGISNFQSSIIDYKSLSTAINHLLQPSQTVKAKEHTQNLSGKNSTSNPPTEAERKPLIMMPYIHKMQQVKQMIQMIIQS